MKHAGHETLGKLAPLLERLRSIPGLVERTPGAFYLRATALLHFHEDPAGIFADVKANGTTFERMQLRTRADETALVKALAQAVARATGRKARR